MVEIKREKNDNMSNFKLITIVLLFLLANFLFLFSETFALDCTNCYPGTCICNITECSSGTLDVYTTLCAGIPIKEFIFANNSFNWTSSQAKNYYLQAYCDSGIKSTCVNVNLTSFAIITTTTTTTTTTTLTPQKTDCPYDCCVGEENYFNRYCPAGYDCINNQCISSATSETATQGNQGYQINYSIVGIVAIVIIAAVFLYYFFTGKKKPAEDKWAKLYKKYARR